MGTLCFSTCTDVQIHIFIKKEFIVLYLSQCWHYLKYFLLFQNGLLDHLLLLPSDSQFLDQELCLKMQELSNSQRSVPNMNRSRECSGQQADTAFSRNFMSDQVQQCFNLNRDSMELGTFGYDMDGNANMASVLQTNLPEPFKAQSVNQLKEGLPEGLSDVVRERGQRWTMEDRLMATM